MVDLLDLQQDFELVIVLEIYLELTLVDVKAEVLLDWPLVKELVIQLMDIYTMI